MNVRTGFQQEILYNLTFYTDTQQICKTNNSYPYYNISLQALHKKMKLEYQKLINKHYVVTICLVHVYVEV